MTRKTRLIILLACVVCFFIASPILVLYSMGYRFSFENMQITETGGIYTRTFPTADSVIIDSTITEKPGMFSNWVFVQSLMPGNHSVLVQKDGYQNYFKTISVLEGQVTKLENIILFKKDLKFQTITDEKENPFNKTEKFIIRKNNLYEDQKLTPVIKNIITFSLQNNSITWLKTDGLLYKSNIDDSSAEPIKLTTVPIKIKTAGLYKITQNDKNLFLNDNGNLLIFNDKTETLDNFYGPINSAIVSPDGKNLVYCDNNNIYLSLMPITVSKDVPIEKMTQNVLYKSSEKINNCLWLNNDYIIFTVGDKVIISEIDIRGNINTITIPQITKNPKIFWDSQEKKLYILTEKNLLLSDQLLP